MTNIFDLRNRVYVITGGAGTLGIKHAEALLEYNGIVVLFDIDDGVVEKAAELKRKLNKECMGIRVDITDSKSIKHGVDLVLEKYSSIYGLINNAANNPKVDAQGVTDETRFETFPEERWNDDIRVGITGSFLMSQAIGPLLAKQGEGVILNVASDLSVIAPDQRIYHKKGLRDEEQPAKPVTYSVTKNALIGLTKYLATYWGHKGVRVNAISPGGIGSDSLDPEFVKKIANLIPMGRMACLDEYKGAIVFLCSDASAYMTGQNVVFDGGRGVW